MTNGGRVEVGKSWNHKKMKKNCSHLVVANIPNEQIIFIPALFQYLRVEG
jgi:hypothetical protein